MVPLLGSPGVLVAVWRVMVPSPRGEGGLRGPIGKIRSSGRSGVVLGVRGPDGLLGPRLGRPGLDAVGGLTRGGGGAVGRGDRLLGPRGRRGGRGERAGRSHLGFGRGLLSGSQRRLVGDDHALVTSNRRVGTDRGQSVRVL